MIRSPDPSQLPDGQLLRNFVAEGSKEAFAEIVQRYVDIVFSAARRQVGDAHLAEDVTQGVFLLLVEKGKTLMEHPLLAGWMLTSATHLSRNLVRSRLHAAQREREVAHMKPLATPSTDEWDEIRPRLDEALMTLSEGDRDAVVLRYLRKLGYSEIAATLNTSEGAARQRVSRGVEQLRKYFSARGLAVAGSALTACLRAHAVEAAPAGLGGRLVEAAMRARGGAAAGWVAGAGGKMAAVIAGAVLVVVGAAVLFYRISHRGDVVYLTPVEKAGSTPVQPPGGPASQRTWRVFDTIPALSYSAKNGTRDGSGHVGYIGAGNWLCYRGIDLGAGSLKHQSLLLSIVLTCPQQYQGAEIVAHLDRLDGPVVARLKTASTGGYTQFRGQSALLAAPGGVHDLYLVFSGGGFNVQAIRILAKPRDATELIAATGYSEGHDIVERGATINETRAGSWLRYEGLEFGPGVESMAMTFGCDDRHAGGVIRVRADALDGPVLCEVPVASTGGFGALVTRQFPVQRIAGRHDVYVTFSGGQGIADVSSFQFFRQGSATLFPAGASR